MKDDIDLPHLPECLLGLPLETLHEIQSHTYHAIKADRQQRGEPVAYAVFADNGNIRIWQHEPLDWPEAVPLYSAPQPAAPAQEPSDDKGWKLGNLLTLNQDGYPALGSLFVQIWEGDSVVARVYGESHDEVLSRANALLALYGSKS